MATTDLKRSPRTMEAGAAAYSTPLDQFQLHSIEHFTSDTLWPWFERLRSEDPVHYTANSEFGPYWSITRYADIAACESDVARLSSSSANGGVILFQRRSSDPAASSEERAAFIALDPPRHGPQRRAASPPFSSGAIAKLEPIIRSRVRKILDNLPVNEAFDFVERVAVELTSHVLAGLLGFPFGQRRLLTRISELTLAGPADTPEAEKRRLAEVFEILIRVRELWDDRSAAPTDDLISILCRAPSTRKNNNPTDYMSNISLFIVAGLDTTRHSITGGLLALNQNPDQYEKLRRRPDILNSAVPEMIRWQSSAVYMCRTAIADVPIAGKIIRTGEKVVLWYVSANRDGAAIDRANEFIVDRVRPRHHAAFGFGIHRCLGRRLAEMQLRLFWEEALLRFPSIEVLQEPRRLRSNFIRGYESMSVRISKRN